jgi:hypothetical protein
MNKNRATFELVFRDEAGPDFPGDLDSRLKRFIKATLRAYGFRAVTFKEVAIPPKQQAEDPFV